MDELILFVLAGCVAQLIDGALGMGYGVICNSILLASGLTPLAASASTHVSKLFSTAASGYSHWRFENVDRELFRRLLIPGMVGAVIGACLLSVAPAKSIRPFVSFYLLLMGLRLMSATLRRRSVGHAPTNLPVLGLAGGCADAVGGGGWGPIVTSTLLARGHDSRLSVGSVNAVEFFVAAASAAILTFTAGEIYWKPLLGIALGGVITAPFAAYLCKIAPKKVLSIAVGLLVIGLSVRGLMLALGG